ncbi:MAG: DUF1501 domain-containing protein [Candidatus Eremiobacteraeota bacterium]|nr:DUF1501 domain-containing protein [Candidatus Eremiobacteraeota bacterium]
MANRRKFLETACTCAVLGAIAPAVFTEAASAQTLPSYGSTVDPRNVLVVVQLGGGNDGLNTVVPYSDDAYGRARPTIRLAENQVLKLNDRVGFNPALASLMELYKEGKVALVQGVGYPQPNLSHFEATQIWETASPVKLSTTGWLGRYLDQTPTNPPNLFRAAALGDVLPQALVAQRVDVPAIGALGAFNYNTGKDTASKSTAGSIYDGTPGGSSPYLTLVRDTARAAYHGGDVLRAKIAGYTTSVTYPADGFSQQLKLAAQLIGSQVGSQIIFVSLGSFDTHAGQRNQQDRLLKYLGDGLLAFYKDLAAHGDADRVLTLTFSEFGRRVAQNASAGTDHGTAAPLFVLGGKVKGGVYGEQPSLTELDNGNLRFNVDFRSVYATAIERWLGRSSTEVLAGTFTTLPFV